MIVDVAPQLPALLRSHARLTIRVLPGDVARRYLLRRCRASGRGATERVLTEGPRTRDIGGKATTADVGKAIAAAL